MRRLWWLVVCVATALGAAPALADAPAGRVVVELCEAGVPDKKEEWPKDAPPLPDLAAEEEEEQAP